MTKRITPGDVLLLQRRPQEAEQIPKLWNLDDAQCLWYYASVMERYDLYFGTHLIAGCYEPDHEVHKRLRGIFHDRCRFLGIRRRFPAPAIQFLLRLTNPP